MLVLRRFEAIADVIRKQLRDRHAVEGPERAKAVIERSKAQHRYISFLFNCSVYYICFYYMC